MPEWTGGVAGMAITSAVVAAAFGLATLSHAAEQDAPASAAYGTHELVKTAAPVAAVAEAQNQGHYLSNPL